MEIWISMDFLRDEAISLPYPDTIPTNLMFNGKRVDVNDAAITIAGADHHR